MVKAAAAIEQALEEKTLNLVRPTRRMLKVFRFGPHTHARADFASALSCRKYGRGRDMLMVMEKVTNDAELASAVSNLLTEVGAYICTTPC